MFSYPIGVSGQSLSLAKPVLHHFASNRQSRVWQKESGGQLFAEIDGTMINIVRATGPRRSDRRSRFKYVPSRQEEQNEINALFEEGLHYVGDWHTHPESIPNPSNEDLTSMMNIFKESQHNLNAFVLIIVGKDLPPEGLHVSLHNVQDEWIRLVNHAPAPPL